MSCSASISLATESRLAASVATVASLRLLVLARTVTGPPPKRLATIPAAPFASLSKTLWSPNSPKATTATFGADFGGRRVARGTEREQEGEQSCREQLGDVIAVHVSRFLLSRFMAFLST